jgi:hypothetical protein
VIRRVGETDEQNITAYNKVFFFKTPFQMTLSNEVEESLFFTSAVKNGSYPLDLLW